MTGRGFDEHVTTETTFESVRPLVWPVEVRVACATVAASQTAAGATAAGAGASTAVVVVVVVECSAPLESLSATEVADFDADL